MTDARKAIAEAVGKTSTRCPVGDVVNDILAALAAAGYVVVPREPTRKMWATGADAVVNLPSRAGRLAIHHDVITEAVWRAMIAAAEAEAKETGDE